MKEIGYRFQCRMTKKTKEGTIIAIDCSDLRFQLISELPSNARGTRRRYAIQFTDRLCYPYFFSGVGDFYFKTLTENKTAYLLIEDDLSPLDRR
jgi:hypothetical protein